MDKNQVKDVVTAFKAKIDAALQDDNVVDGIQQAVAELLKDLDVPVAEVPAKKKK